MIAITFNMIDRISNFFIYFKLRDDIIREGRGFLPSLSYKRIISKMIISTNNLAISNTSFASSRLDFAFFNFLIISYPLSDNIIS